MSDTEIAEKGWYLIEKKYRNGQDFYAIKVTEEIRTAFGTVEFLLQEVGEETCGGHNYGYDLVATHYARKPKQCVSRVTKKDYTVLEYRPVTVWSLGEKK